MRRSFGVSALKINLCKFFHIFFLKKKMLFEEKNRVLDDKTSHFLYIYDMTILIQIFSRKKSI